jgi:hypothetical protein
MARVNEVKKAAKDQGLCRICGKPINKGDAYRWIKPYRSTKVVACSTCFFRSSHMCTGKMVTIYEASESLEDALGSWRTYDLDDLPWDDFKDAIEEVVDEYEEAAEAMGEAGEENQNKAEELQSWHSDCDSADVDDYNGECDDNEMPLDLENAEAWKDSVRSAVEDAIAGCPF